MVKKKLLAIITTAIMLFSLVPRFSATPAKADPSDDFGAGLTVTVASPGQIVPGHTGTLVVKVTNNRTGQDPADYAYNMGVQLVLDDGLRLNGLKLASAGVEAPSSDTGQDGEKQVVYWRDIKTLAPTETFEFTIGVEALDNYRKINEMDEVKFKDELGASINVFASKDARQLFEPADPAEAAAAGQYTQTATVDPMKVYPFTVEITDPVREVKGAGNDSTPPVTDGEWGDMSYTAKIVNSDRAVTSFTQFSATIDGGLELYDAKLDGTTKEPVSNAPQGDERVVSWNGISLTPGETKELTFKMAFLNRFMNGGVESDGSVITHGTTVHNMLDYAATVAGQAGTFDGQAAFDAKAMDITVHKSVDRVAGTGYGSELEYTLTVKTNEYYDVHDVVVTDTIGDGQTFDDYAAASGDSYVLSKTAKPGVVKNGDGTTTLVWNLGADEQPVLGKNTSVTLKYKTTIDSTWSAPPGTKPVVAGDVIENKVDVEGKTDPLGIDDFQTVTDSWSTAYPIDTPNIDEAIQSVTGYLASEMTASQAKVTIGDTVTFKVDYKAAGLNVKQHSVEIIDFLPLGTVLLNPNTDVEIADQATVSEYAINGVSPKYYTASNMLVWDFPTDLPESIGDQSTNVKVLVKDRDRVKKDKGEQNIVVLKYANTKERVESTRTSVQLLYAEPHLVIDRQVSKTTVHGGDTVTVTITITNDGETPAYNVNLTEYIPEGMRNNVTLTQDCSGCGSAVGTDKITFDSISEIDPGDANKVTLIYEATIDDPIGALKELKDKTEWTYDSQPSGEKREYEGEQPHSIITAEKPTITLNFEDSATGSATDLRIGDWVVYKVVVTVPVNEKIYNAEIWHTMASNQKYVKLFSSYDKSTDTGVDATHTVNSAGNPVKITLPSTEWDSTHTYYVKTVVDNTHLDQTQNSKADLKWEDQAASGKSHSASSSNVGVKVNKPNLKISISPDTKDMVKDQNQLFTMTIDNKTGKNKAYKFTPTVQIPEGFEFISGDGTVTGAGSAADPYVMTFPQQDELAGGSGVVSFDFTVHLVALKGSGSVHYITGKTGYYYASEAAYADDATKTDPPASEQIDKFEQTTAQSEIHTPSVELTNEITTSSNGGSTEEIRPGDTVQYQLTATVPEGTEAFNLSVEDTIDSLGAGKFEIVGNEIKVDKYENGVKTVSDQSCNESDTDCSDAEIKHWDIAGDKITIAVGDDLDATDGEISYVITAVLRAKSDGSAPDGGSFQSSKQTFETLAIAKWLTVSGSVDPDDQLSTTAVPNASNQTSIDVVQPKVAISAPSLAETQFTDAKSVLQIKFQLNNSWESDALNTSVTAVLPAGLKVFTDGTHAISSAGTLNPDGSIDWDGLTVAKNNGTEDGKLDLTFYASIDESASPRLGSGAIGLDITATLNRYESTPGTETNQTKKGYTPGAQATQTLTVAKLAATLAKDSDTNDISGADYVRPGDEITYTLDIDVPDGSTAYHPVLTFPTLDQQAIVSVTGNNAAPDGAGYTLDDIADQATITIVTRVSTDAGLSGDYNTSIQAKIDYATKDSGGTSLSAGPTAAVSLDVKQPELEIGLASDGGKVEFSTPEDVIPFTITLKNTGHSPAYSANVSVTQDVYVILSAGASSVLNDTVSVVGNVLTWETTNTPIGIGESRTLTFQLKAKTTTPILTEIPVNAVLTAYYSLPNGGGKSYGPLSAEVDTTVAGKHSLTSSGTESATAGSSATFPHAIHNIGGGHDTYKVTLESPYRAELYVDGVTDPIATGDNDAGGHWVWDNIASGYGSGHEVRLSLDADAAQNLHYTVFVPDTEPYDNNVSKNIKLTVTSDVYTDSNQDHLFVIGKPLNGWTGDFAYTDSGIVGGDAAGWVKPVLSAGDPLILHAVSAIHINKVIAVYTYGSTTKELELVLEDDDLGRNIAQGYKKWKLENVHAPEVLLPDDIPQGDYDVTFKGIVAESGQPDDIQETEGPITPVTGVNNAFKVKSSVIVKGTITDADGGAPIENAVVQLIDPLNPDDPHPLTTTTDGSGNYQFDSVPVKKYVLVVAHKDYSKTSKEFYAIPEDDAADNTVIVNAKLSQYRIVLTANPTNLLGNGTSASLLRATITDTNGVPISGINAQFTTDKGTFPNSTKADSALTNEDGVAEILLTSEVIAGTSSVRFPVEIEVNDIYDGFPLHASTQIVMTFEPGVVQGIVTEMNNGVVKPVAGAIVVVSNADYDFSESAVTGSDGAYAIAIPRSNVVYDVTITKPVKIGNVEKWVTFTQKANVNRSFDGDFANNVFDANKGAGGVVLVLSPDKESSAFPAAMYGQMLGYLVDENGDPVNDALGNPIGAFTINSDGTFNVQNLPIGTYQLKIELETKPGEKIFINKNKDKKYTKLEVTADGIMNIAEELIDPYGTVTDAGTGLPIEDAHVELYYADTARNGTNGGKLVGLPKLDGFAPRENANPQDTNAAGEYAWMVFSEKDYIVKVSKPGYYTDISKEIPVEFDIVRHNVQLRRIPALGFLLAPPSETSDLAVSLFSDRPSYEEGDIVTFTVEYLNRNDEPVRGVSLNARIPQYTQIVDAAGGTVDHDMVRWELGDLEANAFGSLTYQVKVEEGALPKAEVLVGNQAAIGSKDPLIHLEDDQSSIGIMLFTNRFGHGKHLSYIVGYPDKEFKPLRAITRAEIATIFAKIMELDYSKRTTSSYADVRPEHWASGFIEASTRAGLFSGYEGNTFKPDQAITRAELSTVIAKYLKLTGAVPIQLHFNDIENHWAKNNIEEIFRYHIIKGYMDGSFKPDATMIREEAVTMINQMLHRGPLTNIEPTFPDVAATRWSFGHVEESAVSHEYERNSDGSEKMVEAFPEEAY